MGLFGGIFGARPATGEIVTQGGKTPFFIRSAQAATIFSSLGLFGLALYNVSISDWSGAYRAATEALGLLSVGAVVNATATATVPPAAPKIPPVEPKKPREL